MFTGIVESIGTIRERKQEGSNTIFFIESPLSHGFKVDQSIAHDGVCLTVEEVTDNLHRVTAVAETLKKTTLSDWETGKAVNLEQALLPNKRMDGHFVQGHVDGIGYLKKIQDKKGSYELSFSFPKKFAGLVIEKGSISINGVSLTIFEVKKSSFRVAIIPYTFYHTTFQYLAEGDAVNLEFDLVGKYILRNATLLHR